MSEEDKKLLAEEGWEVDCEDPFELSKVVDGITSRATGEAARIVLEVVRFAFLD